MRHYLFLMLFFLCPVSLVAQSKNQMQEKEVQTSDTSTTDPILRELQIIRGIQKEAQDDRRNLWKKIDKKKKEHKEVSETDMSNEYGAMLKIADNTRQDFLKDDWNVYGWVAFAIALLSLIVAGITLWAQWQTEKHTSNAPINVQLWKLKDLPRHFYRNLVCTCALIFMYKSEGEEMKRKRYPSESNLGKLKVLEDDVVLPIDVDETKDPLKNPYKYMHELKLLLRNYNVEVEVASNHLSRKNISDDSLKQDFDNLLFKPFFLIINTFDFEKSLILQKNKKSFVKVLTFLKLKKENLEHLAMRTLITVVREHFKKLHENDNFQVLLNKDTAKKYLDIVLKDHQADIKIVIEGKEINEDGGFDRSVNKLIKYGEKEGSDVSSLDRKTIMEEVIRQLHTGEQDYKSYFGVGTNNQKTVHPGILTIENKDQFVSFCERVGYVKDIDKPKCEELYHYIAPYLNFLREEKWEVHTLLKYILAIDAAIETDRIGMVNFS